MLPAVPKALKSTHIEHVSVWQHLRDGPLRIALIGSGNWGSAIAKILGINAKRSYFFEDTVQMYVREEEWKGEKLTDVINREHENVKYLPGTKLPENVFANPDLISTVDAAHVLVFCAPHQFIQPICQELVGHIRPGAIAISLVKGLDLVAGGHVRVMSSLISRILNVECSSLSGANVADGVAREEFSETTIGYSHIESAQVFQQLFDTPWFKVTAVPDVIGVEICGALKNVVALSAGFVDGLHLGSNTKAAILRIGLSEIRKFSNLFVEGAIEETFWESAGLADLLTSSYGGRNRRCAEEFVRSGRSWLDIERDLLNGQKLQGTHTCRDVHAFLTAAGKLHEFPLFDTTYQIADCGADPRTIVSVFMVAEPRPIIQTRTRLSSKL